MITIHVGYYKEEGRLGCSSIQQKCNYSMKKYVHLISGDGLKADPQKVVVAIMKMQKPTNLKSMQQFTEFVNCLAKFLPNLSTICEPLPKLSCKDTSYTWQSQHEATFKKIKQLATAAPALQFYVTKEITIQCDASSSGLGAVLMQDGHPRAYTSKALTATERNYAQNEKEYIYIYIYILIYIHNRTMVTMRTYHKPLETTFKKALLPATKQLQCMLWKLHKYNLQVQYKRGVEMHIADFLSRKFTDKGEKQQLQNASSR